MQVGHARIPGMRLVEHELVVPLDHADPDGESITVFAREVVASRRREDGVPWLVYLQGGPGHSGPRPLDRSGWLGRAVQEYRVLLLDQRGTGRSTPQTRQTLAGLSASDQADRLAHFRADEIVHDAEAFRRELAGDQPWTLLGQSFGGFVAMTYLSFAPQGVRDAVVTGGIPPIGRAADEVYDATYDRVASRQRRFTERYPDDQQVLDALADRVAAGEVHLPSGARLTVERLQQLGHGLGMSTGADALHYLLETAFTDSRRETVSDLFLAGLEHQTSFVHAPIYALLHEAIYCDGPGQTSAWSAQRVRDKRPELSGDVRPLSLTGEMIYPGTFTDDPALAPLTEAAHVLAERDDWPRLYDVARLAASTVPVAAAVYHDDMYVESAYSMEAADRIGACEMWVTNEFSHDGLRSDDRVFDRLLQLNADRL